MDCGPPGSSVLGISQARTLEWVATPGDLPDPGIEPLSLASPASLHGKRRHGGKQEAPGSS